MIWKLLFAILFLFGFAFRIFIEMIAPCIILIKYPGCHWAQLFFALAIYFQVNSFLILKLKSKIKV